MIQDAYNNIASFLDKTRKPIVESTFKTKLFKAYGISDHPKAEEAYRISVELAGKENYYDILNVLHIIYPLLCERNGNG